MQAIDPFNPIRQGAFCFDATHNLHFNLLYHMPNWKFDNIFASKFLNGWWLANIVTVQTGYPFTPVLSVIARILRLEVRNTDRPMWARLRQAQRFPVRHEFSISRCPFLRVGWRG